MSALCAVRDAFEAFHSGDHAKCGQLLDQLSGVKGSVDVKIAHNKLLNDYYKSGCADPQQLLANLSQAHDRARERDKKDKGRKKRDEDEEETYREEEDFALLRYNQALLCMQLRQHAQAAMILEELFENIEPIDDYLAIRVCFLLLELCLSQRDPEQAVAVLAYLEKPTAFLSVLRSERPTASAASKVLDVGAGAAGDGDAAEGGVAPGEGESANAAEAKAEAASAEDAKVEGGAAAAAPSPETPTGPLPSLAVGAFLPRHGRAPDTISRAEYRFFCLMYRARVSVALKNAKAAKKDAKNAVDVLEGDLRQAPLLVPHPHTTGGTESDAAAASLRESLHSQHQAMVNMLKAYLEYTRQNVRKAMKLLTLCQFNFAESRMDNAARVAVAERKKAGKGADEEDDTSPTDFHPAQDEACAPFFFNNLGCIHFMMSKPRLAAFYFQKALRAMVPSPEPMGDASLRLPGVMATRHWLDRRAEVAYNAGLQMAMCEQPAAALQSFQQCAPVFRQWPRLWLRMAECYIEVFRRSQACLPSAGDPRDGDAAVGDDGLLAAWCRAVGRPGACDMRPGMRSVRGGRAHRRWLLSTARSLPVGQRSSPTDDEAQDAEARPPDGEDALMQAVMCLRNVLSLVTPALPERQYGGAGSGDAGAESGAATSGGASSVGNLNKAAAAGATGADSRSAKAPATSSSASPKAGGPGAGAGPRHQARDLLESEASLLEDAALVKLAYVCLCQRDFAAATRHSRRLLEKNGLVGQPGAVLASGGKSSGAEDTEEVRSWTFRPEHLPHGSAPTDKSAVAAAAVPKFASSIACVTLAVNYAAEALLAQGRTSEARALLGPFVTAGAAAGGAELLGAAGLDQHIVGLRAAAAGASDGGDADGASDEARQACAGRSPTASLGGLSPPCYVLQCLGSSGASQAAKDRSDSKGEAASEREKNSSKESSSVALVAFPASDLGRVGEMQCALYTNLAAIHVQDGHLGQAEACCRKALAACPRAAAPLRTLVYVLLRRGDHAQALKRLKQSRL